MNSVEARRLVVTGLVQGVGFRYATIAEANRLGLAGWVRNRREGSVEAVAWGSPAALAALLAWARRGPPGARVDHLHVELPAVPDSPPSSGFTQRPTE